ncbi:MAG: hypothetical protein ACTSRZ_21375 [Promethearchaeota archaeon]
MIDFTIKLYEKFLKRYKITNFHLCSFINYINKNKPKDKIAILRHNVDHRPLNALKMEEIEADAEIAATYYFRSIPPVFQPDIIQRISDFGHEIGYYYENLSLVHGIVV